jgi:COMPASS component SWD3
MSQTGSSNLQAQAPPNYVLRGTLTGHRMPISAVKFSPDGKWIASAGASLSSFGDNRSQQILFFCCLLSKAADKTVRIWSTFDGAFEAMLEGHQAG